MLSAEKFLGLKVYSFAFNKFQTYKEPETDELKYDVHFWIGKYSTQVGYNMK